MLLRLSALTSLLAALPVSTVLGGQIPVVNGVVGGTDFVPTDFKVEGEIALMKLKKNEKK